MTCDKTDNGLGFGTINVTITRSPLGLLSPASHQTRQLLFNSARTAPHDNELNSTSRFSGDFPRRIRRKVMRPIWSLPTIPRTSSLVAHQSIRQGRERSQCRNNRHSYRDCQFQNQYSSPESGIDWFAIHRPSWTEMVTGYQRYGRL